MRRHVYKKRTTQKSRKLSYPLLSGSILLIQSPSVHGLPLTDREMINVVTTMIVAIVVLGGIANRAGHHRQTRILMIVHPVTVFAHAVYTVMEAALGPRTAPDPDPLWCVVVRTVMRLKVVQPAYRASLFKKS